MTTIVEPITPPGVITQEFRTPAAVRRGVIAGFVGNVLEWYDFALFGFFAQQIGAHFFPAGDPTASLLAAFGTFAAGFLMRPVGGALFGWVGDRFGRKQALIWSVMAMAIPSFCIGVLPSTATIGLAAPILLLVFRLLQGIAVGGEYMASAVFLVEGAPPGRRGWMGSWGPLGAFAGTLLGSAAGAIVNASMSPEAVMAYGWRIPFILGIGGWTGRPRHPAPLRGAGAPPGAVQVSPRRSVPEPLADDAAPGGADGRAQRRVLHHVRVLRHVAEPGGRSAGAHRARGEHAGDGNRALHHSCRRCGERSAGSAHGAGRRGGSARAAGLPADGADGAGAAGRHHRGRDRTGSADRGPQRRDAGHDGRAGALAGALHRAVGGVQSRDGPARGDDAAGRSVAGRADRGAARAGVVSRAAAALTFIASLLLPATARHSLTKEFDATRFR